jgi:acyl-CoA reductase-like NAD-dependent aldehyde dehydrogenase
MPKIQHAKLKPGKLWIGGEWVDAVSGSTFETENPATEDVLTRVAEAGPEDVDRAVRAARKAYTETWSVTPPAKRARILSKTAELIMKNRDELAEIETLDQGKVIFESSKVDVPMASDAFAYYSGWATKLSGKTIPHLPNMLNYTLAEPYGVVGQIIPWNFPLLMAAWKLAPALAAGNTVVLKPAEQTPLSVLRLGELMVEAGLPAGVVNNIVFDDADLESAARGAITGIFYNKGEACTAGSRLFVQESIANEFEDLLGRRAGKSRPGDPLDPKTKIGPLVSAAQRDKVESYVKIGQEEGATLMAGGSRADIGNGKGYFYEPTIFTNVENSMRVASEEIFGPVLAVIRFKDMGDVKLQANDNPYGLAAGIWTRDIGKAHRAAQVLQAGTVWINTYGLYSAAVPFGGTKESGFGRELGEEGLRAYTRTKSVWVNLD